jgi:hypothetical protein
LKHARGSPAVFTSRAIEAIYQYSGGLPRLINVICDNSMINAYALDLGQIEPALIQEVAEDLHLSSFSIRPVSPRRDLPPAAERPLQHAEVARPQPVQIVKVNRSNGVTNGLKSVSTNRTIPEGFFIWLREALVDAMGPMAHIVLAEHVKLLGESLDHFAHGKIEQLIESVSHEIFDQSIRARFRESVAARLNELQRA